MTNNHKEYWTTDERTTFEQHIRYWTDDERIGFQLKNEETDAQKLYCYLRLFASVSHSEDVSDLDRRTHFLTISLIPNCLKPTHSSLYGTYQKAHTGSYYNRSPDRPGIIFDDDVAGSKYGEGRNENHHFHGLLIAPKALNRQIFGEDGEHKLLICPVEKMSNVQSVHTIPFDLKKSLSHVIGYGSKFALSKNHEAYGIPFISEEFPWTLDRSAKGLRKWAKEAMLCRYDNNLNLFYTNPAALFSDEYMDLYGAEIEMLCKRFPLSKLRRTWHV